MGTARSPTQRNAPELSLADGALSQLLRNESGHFVRVVRGAVFQKEGAGRGAAFGDIDNDSDVDIVVSNVGQRAYVL